jgi:hypothetical protein
MAARDDPAHDEPQRERADGAHPLAHGREREEREEKQNAPARERIHERQIAVLVGPGETHVVREHERGADHREREKPVQLRDFRRHEREKEGPEHHHFANLAQPHEQLRPAASLEQEVPVCVRGGRKNDQQGGGERHPSTYPSRWSRPTVDAMSTLSRRTARLYQIRKDLLTMIRRFFPGATLTALALPAAMSAQQQALPLKHAPQPTAAVISAADLMTRLYVFADDSMQGRETGTVGHLKSTAYIASELKRLGLQPGGDEGSYFQEVPMVRRSFDPASTITIGSTTLRGGSDFIAQSRGAIPSLDGASVVFGGTAGDTTGLPSHDQIAGKIVVLKAAPGGGFAGGRPGAGGGDAADLPRSALSDAVAIVIVTDARFARGGSGRDAPARGRSHDEAGGQRPAGRSRSP